MDAATSLIEGNVDNYNQSASIPWAPGSMVTMVWLMMVPALLAIAFAAGGLLFAGRGTVTRVALPRAAAAPIHS